MASKSPSLVLVAAVSLLLLNLPLLYAGDVVKGGYWLSGNGFLPVSDYGFLPVSDINSTLFTHLFCAFAELNSLTNQVSLPSDCTSFASNVRQINPSVKILISIGGGAASSNISSMASHPNSRQAFINSSISLARSYGFEGLELDWVSPTNSSDMNNLGALLGEWREAVNSESSRTGSQSLILTAAVAVNPQLDPQTSFPVQAISKNLDWVNVLAYDFYTPERSPNLTRSPAALYDSSPEGISGSSGIAAWIKAGMPPKKLVLGIPFYGYTWKLIDPTKNGILAPANGSDMSVNGGAAIRYADIRKLQTKEGAVAMEKFNSTYVTGYSYWGTTWIGYDDGNSTAEKVSYAKNNGLLGYAAWRLDQDDDAFTLSTQAFQAWPIKGKSGLPHFAILVLIAVLVAILLAIGIWMCHRRRKATQTSNKEKQEIIAAESLQFDLATIKAATHNFILDNKLGQGGFGEVYKGKLGSGQEIAVKRLSKNSGQGILQFKTEVALLAKLQHKNLVKLLGFCVASNEKIVVYEFLPNSSLDRFLSDPVTKATSLDWKTRFKIIFGIARGLLYLHEDSRLKVIHRDLKTSNILLDESMNPKISDFGLAKLFDIDQTEDDTKRIVGTYGYMAPEYAITGHYSVKSDVFSFGVIVLEIVSGQKNRYFARPQIEEALLHRAWRLWTEENILDLVDPSLGNNCEMEEITKCIHIGLLSIQEDPARRPRMNAIVAALNGDPVGLPKPKAPQCFGNSTESGGDIEACYSYSIMTEDITDLCPR